MSVIVDNWIMLGKRDSGQESGKVFKEEREDSVNISWGRVHYALCCMCIVLIAGPVSRGCSRVVAVTGNQVSTSLGNSGLCWTVFARNRDTAVSAEGNGDLQTLICVLVARPRRCLTLSNPVPWQNWMAAYLGYTLRMRTLFRGWPIMVNDTHTRRRRLTLLSISLPYDTYRWQDDAVCMNLRTIRCGDYQIAQKIVQMVLV